MKASNTKAMHPTTEQIQRAAYNRWEQRGGLHGHDRDDWIAAEMDLTFELNYTIIVHHSLGETKRRLLGDQSRTRCRFCEQSPPRAAFSHERLVIPAPVGNSSLFTGDLCDECGTRFDGSIDEEFLRFWSGLESIRTEGLSFRDLSSPRLITPGAHKALVRMALSIVPDEELGNFTDTLEWVGNPDVEFDSGLFGDTRCLAYQTHVPYPAGWVSLARRADLNGPYPYMLFALAASRLVLQIHLPLCSRDEDLDGYEVRMPERSYSTGPGADLRPSIRLVLPFRTAEASRQSGARRSR